MDLLVEPRAWLLVAVVTLVGTATNLVLYKLGKEGAEVVLERFPRIDPERLHRAQDLVATRGSWVLLLSGIPWLGAVLVTSAGILEVALAKFLLWVLISLGVRNWLVLIAVVEGYQLVAG
jgi:membrane protein YqaA with SNARE-associated domain